MINKETYKDIGKAYKTCLTDNAEICFSAYFYVFTNILGGGEGH